MENTWFLAALWTGLALVATLLAIWFRVSTALSEIVVGTVAQLIVVVLIGGTGLGAQTPWIGFLAGTGAIVLTFLAGAEIDPAGFPAQWEGGGRGGGGGGGLFRALPRLSRDRLLHPSLGADAGLAGRRGALDDVRRGRLRGHARARLQHHGIWKGDPGGLLHQRPRHRDRPRLDLRALHGAHGRLRRGVGGRLRRAAVRHATILPPLRRARIGDRNQVHSAGLVLHGGPRALGGQRAGVARVHHRHGPGRDRRQGPRPDPAVTHADLRAADALLLPPRRVPRVRARARRRPRRPRSEEH